MPIGLLSIEDSELEKVSGGLIIEKDCNGSVSRVIASREEYGYITSIGYSKERSLTAEDVQVVKLQLSRFGFRVKSCVKLASKKFLPKSDYNRGRAELVVID